MSALPEKEIRSTPAFSSTMLRPIAVSVNCLHTQTKKKGYRKQRISHWHRAARQHILHLLGLTHAKHPVHIIITAGSMLDAMMQRNSLLSEASL